MGTIPALYLAIVWKAGWDMSKWGLGGLHQPPLSLGSAKFGGQKFVAVIVMEVPLRHHWGTCLASQTIW